MFRSLFGSLFRGLPRILLMLAIGELFLTIARDYPLLVGPVWTPLFMGFAMVIIGLAVGDAALRIMMPHVDTQAAADRAMDGCAQRPDGKQYDRTANALIFLGHSLFRAVILVLVVSAPRPAEGAPLAPPQAALAVLPVLKSEQARLWHELPMPSALGAQIYRETCPSDRHRFCFSVDAELKTAREQGRCLGQYTRSWDKFGRLRFDALAEQVRLYPKELEGLSWARPCTVVQGVRFVILKDRDIYNRIKGTCDDVSHLKMMASAYNGGEGGLRQDRLVCSGTQGCNPGCWDGHVAKTSLKAMTAVPGYGKPFFQINREYADRVVDLKPVRERFLLLDA